jgi:hypothetical protein
MDRAIERDIRTPASVCARNAGRLFREGVGQSVRRERR